MSEEAPAGEDRTHHEEDDMPTELPSRSGRVRSHSLRPRADRNVAFFTPETDFGDGVSPAAAMAGGTEDELMGSIIRRKRVISLPLGVDPRRSSFFGAGGGGDASTAFFQSGYATPPDTGGRVRQFSGGAAPGTVGMPHSSPKPRRRQSSFIQGLLGRKGVALDLVAPEDVDFFAPIVPEDVAEEKEPSATAPVTTAEGLEEVPVTEAVTEGEPAEAEEEPAKKLFKPLRFSKPLKPKGGGGGGHGGGHGAGGGAAPVDDEIREFLEIQLESQQKLKKQLEQLTEGEDFRKKGYEWQSLMAQIKDAANEVDEDTENLQRALGMEKIPANEQTEEVGPFDDSDEAAMQQAQEETEMKLAPIEVDPGIKKAGRSDFIYTGVLICVMIAFTGVVLGWHTEIDEDFSVFGTVGLACSTQCLGHLESQNYLRAHKHFETDNVLHLKMRLDPNPDEEAYTLVQLVGAETGETKKVVEFGPPEPEEHTTYETDVDVDFDHPGEEHILNVFSTNEGTELTQKECTSPCFGNLTSQNYFSNEKSSFVKGEYIQLVMQLFPSEHDNTFVNLVIKGADSGQIKQNVTFGPAPRHEPGYFTRTIEVGFDNPGEEHIIDVYSNNEEDPNVEFMLSAYTNNNTILSFTLYTMQLKPLAKYSELIAALIMIVVYLFILLELVHRTLVAIGGSVVALFFLFLMHNVS